MIRSHQIRKYWPLALVLTALAFLQAKACLMDVLRIRDYLTIDDTFLYLQIARNVALGKGPTFDGIHLTNGFQPLWLLAVVPLGWVFREPVTFLRATLFLCAILNLVTTWLLYRMGLRLAGRRLGVPLIVGWTWVVVGWQPMLLGMETSLYAMLFVAFLDRLLRPQIGRKGLGILGGLLLLCRVDAL
ncbi:MAG: hypothetical protein MUE60_10625, partial [Candidatus Eisenbacteria bacterium]|nr:hypothetical protein [Candidatus Eisenbacteria bacterium]